MFSYWDRKHFTRYDNIIVGAGLSGLFTALNLKRKFPNQSVLVLEKDILPAASTKNAGFGCMGSITELEDDLQQSSKGELISLFEKRYSGLKIMCDELGRDNISYKENGSYELLDEKDCSAIDKVEQWNKDLFDVAKSTTFSIDRIETKPFKDFSAIIRNELEAEIDTGKMYQTLRIKVQSMGVEIYTNTRVLKYEKGDAGYHIFIKDNFQLSTKRLIFCTNAFTQSLIPEFDIMPARGQVIITKPIMDLPFKGIYHFDRGYYYFREIDGRVLFGGGRQLDEAGETTSEFGTNELILNDLETKLKEQILPNNDFEIDYSWSGIMGKATSKEPFSKQVDENLFVLASFGGMGVALAPFMAKELVQSIN